MIIAQHILNTQLMTVKKKVTQIHFRIHTHKDSDMHPCKGKRGLAF